MAENHVLVIDENPAVQAIATLALAPLGVKVLTVSSPQDGLRAAQEQAPAIIICPHEIVATDVIELCAQLKRVCPLSRLLMLTSHRSLDSLRSDPALAAVDDFLAKPFKSERLRNAVSGLLNRTDAAVDRPDDLLIVISETLIARGVAQTVRALGFGAETVNTPSEAIRQIHLARFKGLIIDNRMLSGVTSVLHDRIHDVIILRHEQEAGLQLADIRYRVVLRPVSVGKLRGALDSLFGNETAQGLRDQRELAREEQSTLAAQISAAVFEKLLTAEALKKGNWKLAGNLAAEELLRICGGFKA